MRRPRNVPFSEDEAKYKDWTAAQCIEELQRIAQMVPDRAISRNFFRVFSSISESTWTKHFGTFLEFKRQAGVIPGRHVQQHEKNIAKHAAHDCLRDMNHDKAQYEGKYDKPRDKRWQDLLIGSVVHDIDCDLFWRRTFIDTASGLQPEMIVLNGDVFDLPEFSRFDQDPRDWDLIGRIEWVHTFLADLRRASPESQIDLISGNHEHRILKHLSAATPAMRCLLADLHGWTIGRLLGLDEYEVNFHCKQDLAAWSERDMKNQLSENYKVYHQFLLSHHFPQGRTMGLPGWCGHHHVHRLWHGFSPLLGPFEFHQVGAGHRRDASYCDAAKWSNGFLIAHADTQSKKVAFDYIQVLDHAVVGGKRYYRNGVE